MAQNNTQLILTDEHTSKTIYLENENSLYFATTNQPFTAVDSLKQLDFTLLQNGKIKTIEKGNYYWFRFTIHNHSQQNKWLLEQFDFHIGELLFLDPSLSDIKSEGYAIPFDQRVYQHKNPVFNLNLKSGETKTYYLRAHSNIIVKDEFRIRSVEFFTSYAIKEYLYLGVYYGILAIIVIYFFIVCLQLKDTLYLSFSFFIFTVINYSFTRDGLGYQLFWEKYPALNFYSYYFSPLLFLVAYTNYTNQFLKLKINHKTLWNTNWIAVIFYILCYILDLLVSTNNSAIYFLPLPIMVVYYSCVRILVKGDIVTKYFFVGSTLIIVGSTLFMLNSLKIIPNNIITVYGSNFGVMIDIFAMTIALNDRLRLIRKSKEELDHQLILQLQETTSLKDKVNRELEEKVEKRTHELNVKVEELDLLNQKLNEQAELISNMNSSLDLDNYQLKRKVKQATSSWMSKKEITFEEFKVMFPDDVSCIKHLAKTKWKKEYKCKKCGNTKYTEGKVFKAKRCTKCGYDETPTSNTIFSRTKIPIQKAFYLAYKIYHTNGKVKVSNLSKELDLNPSTAKYYKDRVLKKIPNIETISSDEFWKSAVHDI